MPVPTYLLQDACVLAHDGIVARLDRSQDWRPFFRVDLGPPARAVHDSWDCVDMAGRFVDALALIRQLTGRAEPDAEAGLRRYLLSAADATDGLFYNAEGPGWPQAADMFCQSRALIALCTWFMDTGDSEALGCARRLVHGLAGIAERFGSGLRYPRNLYRHGEWLEGGLFYQPKDLLSVKPGYGGTQLEGLMRYHELSADPAALDFARAYVRFFLDEAGAVAEDGSFTGHLHSQGIVPTLNGAAMVAQATGDRALAERCLRAYEFILANSSSFGWVPDGIGWPTCETCALGDVVYLGLRLARLGLLEPWATLETFARNQLLANQFVDAPLALAGRSPETGVDQIVRGSFASWARPNDLLGGPDLEGCCTGGGVRALFHVLSSCVAREPNGTVAVRMLFSVETEDAVVESALPHAGHVRIRTKRDGPLRVRRPEWVREGGVTVSVDGRAAECADGSGWLRLGALPARTQVELTFPMTERTTEENVAGIIYTLTWRGNTVMSILPAGSGYPTYQRHALRAEPAATGAYPAIGTRIVW